MNSHQRKVAVRKYIERVVQEEPPDSTHFRRLTATTHWAADHVDRMSDKSRISIVWRLLKLGAERAGSTDRKAAIGALTWARSDLLQFIVYRSPASIEEIAEAVTAFLLGAGPKSKPPG